MRKAFAIVMMMMVLTAAPAFAELQNVEVGGSIYIRGDFYSSAMDDDSMFRSFWQGKFDKNFWVGGLWDDRNSDSTSYVLQRTRLNVKADFTDDVCAFIELDSWDVWGEDFRSDYITGADFRGFTADDVEVYQAYIKANDMWGYPLSMKIGRQEITLGSEWLVGNNDAPTTGLSFDAIRLTYAVDEFSVDAFWAKLVERSPIEEDGDVDMYGVYASYMGMEDMVLDAYWLLVRDARSMSNAYSGIVNEWIEDLMGVDQYDPTYLHTVGLRSAGMWGAIDWEAEVAYQFGEVDAIGAHPLQFVPGIYPDNSADMSEWGMNLEVGYTLDVAWTPRVFGGFVYYGGEDNREINFWQWATAAIWPWYQHDASVSFNRLFSDHIYSEFIAYTDMSNVWIGRGGVELMPTEKLNISATVSYFETVDPAVNFCPVLPFFNSERDDSLGWGLYLVAAYAYSEDLTFEIGWDHLWVGEGLEEGHFNPLNGLGFDGGTNDDDPNYFYAAAMINF